MSAEQWPAARAQRQRDLVDTDRAGVVLHAADGPLVGGQWLLAHVEWRLWVADGWELDVICTPPGEWPNDVPRDSILGAYEFDRDTERLRWRPLADRLAFRTGLA